VFGVPYVVTAASQCKDVTCVGAGASRCRGVAGIAVGPTRWERTWRRGRNGHVVERGSACSTCVVREYKHTYLHCLEESIAGRTHLCPGGAVGRVVRGDCIAGAYQLKPCVRQRVASTTGRSVVVAFHADAVARRSHYRLVFRQTTQCIFNYESCLGGRI